MTTDRQTESVPYARRLAWRLPSPSMLSSSSSSSGSNNCSPISFDGQLCSFLARCAHWRAIPTPGRQPSHTDTPCSARRAVPDRNRAPSRPLPPVFRPAESRLSLGKNCPRLVEIGFLYRHKGKSMMRFPLSYKALLGTWGVFQNRHSGASRFRVFDTRRGTVWSFCDSETSFYADRNYRRRALQWLNSIRESGAVAPARGIKLFNAWRDKSSMSEWC